MEQMTRRSFLKFMGAAGVWTLAGCDVYPGPSPVSLVPEGWDRGEERWVPSTCFQCPGMCGIKVRVYEGKAKKIEGNRDHPLNRGGICPKGQAGLQVLYDPDRIPGPMRKIGGRSSTEWEAISWDEALDTVASRLGGLRSSGNPHSVAIWQGHYPTHLGEMWGRFARAYGTPNNVDSESITGRAGRLATFLTQGVPDVPGYLLEDTRFLLVFGAAFLESWQPTVYTLRCYGAMRRGHVGQRAKVVVVDPRCGIGASKADEWIPIRPGTDAALALGLAHVIVREGLENHSFISEHAFGFEDWEEPEVEGPSDGGGESPRRHEGFRTMLLRDYSPQRVQEITGVPAEQIERLAREFAQTRPAIAASGKGIGGHSGGLFANMAIHSLNGLVGSLEIPGGVVTQQPPPFRPWPEVRLDDVARAGHAREPLAGQEPGIEGFPSNGSYRKLAGAVLDSSPYPVEALLVYYTNPVFSVPDALRCKEAFDRVPFVVSFSPFMDETTARADIVLPDATYLERLEEVEILPSVGYPVLGFRQPVVAPRLNVRQTGDVLCQLAQRIGGSVAEAFPWPSYADALKERLSGLVSAPGSFRARDGTAFLAEGRSRGFWKGDAYRFEDWGRAFRTPSGKFEFFSQAWKRHVEGESLRSGRSIAEVLQSLGITASGDAAYLPHYEPARTCGDPERFPFFLVTYKTMTHAGGRGGNQPWLQESFGVQFAQRWEPWLEINREKAESLGIEDQQVVWVESERGRVRVRARLHKGLRSDVVCIPFEYGHSEYGRWSRRGGENVNAIIADLPEPATNCQAMLGTRVRVCAIEGGDGA